MHNTNTHEGTREVGWGGEERREEKEFKCERELQEMKDH
jgi:hypothetical protein